MGEECVYLQSYRPTKADLSDMVGKLQERLGKQPYELLEAKHVNCFYDEERAEVQLYKFDNQGNRYQYPLNAATSWIRPLPGNPYMTGTDDSGFSSAQIALPGFHPSGIATPVMADNKSLGYPLAGGWLPTINDLGQSQVENANATEHIRSGSEGQIPSLQELRQLSSAQAFGSSNNYQWTPPTPSTQASQKATAESFALPPEVMNLLRDVIITQAKIAGIASVVADYLTWARKASKSDSTELLQVLEGRVREIHTLAKTNDLDVMSIISDPTNRLDWALRTCLGDLGEEVSRTTSELDRFFRNRYSVEKTLHDQYRPSSREGPPRTPTNAAIVHEAQLDAWKQGF